jgi:transcriptional regulator with XRE-family HTH domain
METPGRAAPHEDTDRTLDAVGPRLKSLRQCREVTLTDLARQTGISASTLSRLEAGLRRPTLEQLLPLARVYGVTLDQLVDAPETGDPRIHLRPVSGPNGMVIVPLTRRPGGIQAYKQVIPPGPADGPDRAPVLATHEGHEWLYVLNGKLRLLLGDRDLVLEPGEVAEFETLTPHWFGPATDQPVEFLSLFGRQGERAHLRLEG